MIRFFLILLITLIVGYISIVILFYLKQKSLLYVTTTSILSNFPTFMIESSGESINIFVLNKESQEAIIYFGGNSESMGQSCDYFSRLFVTKRVYLMDYRGYGDSTGEPSEEGIYSDALALYDKVKLNHTKVSIVGRSLGSGVATYVASQREVSALVLITPFDSIVNVAQELYPYIPISLLAKDRYNSKARVKDIKAPTLILIAQNDTLVTNKRTESLIEAFIPNQLTVETIEGRGHGDIVSDERYNKLIQDFIGEINAKIWVGK
ncbi:MAG: alpha/beta hydrolase [Sulfurovum sp.]